MKSYPFMIRRRADELALNQGGHVELDGVKCKITSIKKIKIIDGMIEVLGMAKEIVKGEQK
ncbi:hypothetical protein AB1K32_15160 [Metabacillus dongyingensis]|uniref:hypothetical protein n=1 Tax=Metabacillus dongyingensis TaxID=2874282 RepID=UPI003B8B348D